MDAEETETEAPAVVGPTAAPGTGHPATNARLGRIGIVLIIVIGVLYVAVTVISAITAPDESPRGHQDGSGGPGRLTSVPAHTARL